MMDSSEKNNHKNQNKEPRLRTILPSTTASVSFATNTLPRIRPIQRTQQLLPVRYLSQPVDPPPSSSHNNNGIRKVIEYVLKTGKKKLTDQTSENMEGASNSEQAPVNNVGTVTTNNQGCSTSLPIRQNTTKPSSIVVTHNGANTKCIPSVPTSKLTPHNQTVLENSVQIFNFSKTSASVNSTSNNNQNGVPQISDSARKQYFNSFANYIPTQLEPQLLPNTNNIANQARYRPIRPEPQIIPHTSNIENQARHRPIQPEPQIIQNTSNIANQARYRPIQLEPQIIQNTSNIANQARYRPIQIEPQLIPHTGNFENQARYRPIQLEPQYMPNTSNFANEAKYRPMKLEPQLIPNTSNFENQATYRPIKLEPQIIPNTSNFENQARYRPIQLEPQIIPNTSNLENQERYRPIQPEPQIIPNTSNLENQEGYRPIQPEPQIIPNTSNFENQQGTSNVDRPNYDTQMLPSIQYTNQVKNHVSLCAPGSNPAYRMCNPPSHNIPLTQFPPIGNSIKPGIPKLSAHEVKEEPGICPVILHPNKQLSSQIQMKSEALIKTIGFAPARSQMTAQAQSRIVTTSLQRSIMESQNVSPLIITPSSHVIHSANEIVPAKIVPVPSAPAVSHFSVINKTGFYDSLPEFTGVRQSLVSGTPPVYTQSDFARFPPKSYHHKNTVINPAVLHGPIPGNIDEPCINIPNSQHVFKPIISPRPSILRKRDADGVLRAQKNLIPLLTKPEIEECQNIEDTSLNRNGYNETGLQIESIMVPQIPEGTLLPQITALSRQSHIMVEISPRKKPRKQLLPVNQEESPFKIVGDDMEYVDEKLIKIEKPEDFPDDDLMCNDDLLDGDAEDEAEDDLDDMDVDDDCPADDDYDDDDDDFGNDFGDEFDYIKSEKPFFEDVKTEVSDESSACIKPKNKRPTLLGSYKNTWRGHTHHFQRYTDFKIKETKKQLADMQQAKKWTSDSISGWRVRHLLQQFDGMISIEDEIIARMTELIAHFEATIKDLRLCHHFVELTKDNIQRSKVSKIQLEEVRHQLKKIFDYKTIIEDVVDKYCPKDLKKKYAKVFNLSKS
ncbi:uncharacterized protein LOC111030904 isoform X4 [Myzus persicae]|uniref:uncharacterized protein LOC111030904 isoform X4 n=1 Tax=Myzus persicae TaxID=13164 RepID=UPI000B931C8B|nr:uncharacterized protein LOC111030904 isoform X4 [Myzus persicae]